MHDSAHEQRHPDSRNVRSALKRTLWILAIIALLLAVIGITVRLVERSKVGKRTSEDAEMTVVTVKPDLSQAGDELVLPGTVQAYMEASIYARTSGYLKTWHQDIGARVHRGELLAEIETPEVDRQLSQGLADLATARANASLARTTNQRWQGLATKQAVSKQDAEDKAGDAAAKAAAQVSAEQNVARLQDLKSFKRVTAPFDGVVTARNTDVGALINAGQSSGTELFRVADIHRLRVFAQVPEAYALATRTGLVAELHFAERPGQTYPTAAVRTSNALDPTARTLQVELELDNEKEEFLPGAYTEIHFKLPSDSKTMRLPSNTVLFRSDGLQVGVVTPDHKVHVKNVTQGRDFGKTVEILDGLDAQDDVIVNPSDSIDEGIPVRIAPPKQDSDSKAADKGDAGKSDKKAQQDGGTK
jgi:RND family efflux transporter MFP subunit